MNNLVKITTTQDFNFKSWVSYSGRDKSYFFVSLITKNGNGNKQLTSNRIIESKYLNLKEINQQNLEHFHFEAVNYFTNKIN